MTSSSTSSFPACSYPLRRLASPHSFISKPSNQPLFLSFSSLPFSLLNMFGHNKSTELPYDYTSEFHGQFSSLPDTAHQTSFTSPLFIPPLAIPSDQLDSVSALRSEIGYTSSGCSSYGGSPTSITSYAAYSPTVIPRSHSLHTNMEVYSPMNSSPPGYFECESSSVRKVLSAGDLQRNQRSSSNLVNENSILESMNRANPYSPEEKKERIERYRSKKNLRNFNKKIKYECRKTLADSRPRIRGRFARNDEIEKTAQSQWDQTTVEEYEEEDEDNWINFLDAFSANLMS